jgi:hypothetical protein
MSPPVAPPAPVGIQREINVTGTWEGSYVISRCWPTSAPNPCDTRPGTLTLTLLQDGQVLSGTFKSSRWTNPIDVTGSVDVAGAMTLGGERLGVTNCFSVGPLITGVVARVGDWQTSVTKAGTITGTLKQFELRRVSSCYQALFEYVTEVSALRRDPVVKNPLP